MEPLMTTQEAAKYLSVSKHTLSKWRHENTGPTYYLVGDRAVRYKLSDLDNFIKQQQEK